MPSITCPVCGRSRSDKIESCIFCEIAKDGGSTTSGLSEDCRVVESDQKCQKSDSSTIARRKEERRLQKEPVTRLPITRYHVVFCDGPTSLTRAVRDVEEQVREYLEKGWKPHGSISVSGWYEDDVARYCAAQALTKDE